MAVVSAVALPIVFPHGRPFGLRWGDFVPSVAVAMALMFVHSQHFGLRWGDFGSGKSGPDIDFVMDKTLFIVGFNLNHSCHLAVFAGAIDRDAVIMPGVAICAGRSALSQRSCCSVQSENG